MLDGNGNKFADSGVPTADVGKTKSGVGRFPFFNRARDFHNGMSEAGGVKGFAYGTAVGAAKWGAGGMALAGIMKYLGLDMDMATGAAITGGLAAVGAVRGAGLSSKGVIGNFAGLGIGAAALGGLIYAGMHSGSKPSLGERASMSHQYGIDAMDAMFDGHSKKVEGPKIHTFGTPTPGKRF